MSAKKWPFDPGRPPAFILLNDGRVAVITSELQAKEFFLALADDYLRCAGRMAGKQGKAESAKTHRLAAEYLIEQSVIVEINALQAVRKEQDIRPNETTKDYLERMQAMQERRAR